MCNENLPPIDHLREWDGTVLAPLFHGRRVLDEDDEVIIIALEVDFVNADVAASHGEIAFEFEGFALRVNAAKGCCGKSRDWVLISMRFVGITGLMDVGYSEVGICQFGFDSEKSRQEGTISTQDELGDSRSSASWLRPSLVDAMLRTLEEESCWYGQKRGKGRAWHG
jgi:hypothetical protein